MTTLLDAPDSEIGTCTCTDSVEHRDPEQLIEAPESEIGTWSNSVEYRAARQRVCADAIDLGIAKDRAEISEAKMEFLQAVQRVIEELRPYWPISDRRIHYCLLNDPPLKHASKPDSRYRNDKESYRALTDLLTRGRIAGDIPMEAIGDETRPIILSYAYADPSDFIHWEPKKLFCGYYRDRQRSQPAHVELICEKMTAKSILEPIAEEFCLPLTTGRGFSSLPPRYDLVNRFLTSGKDQLIVIFVTDFDPSGESICKSFGQSLVRDFEVDEDQLQVVKAGLTFKQIQELNLPGGGMVKMGDSRAEDFINQYGREVYELEAVSPKTLQDLLRAAIEAVFDMEAFKAEVDQEREDAVFLERERVRIINLLRGAGWQN